MPTDVATRVRAGHPWIYREALGGRGLSEPTGALVEVITGNRDVVARGYVDREHPVAIRVLTRDPGERVAAGSGAVAARFARAVQLRWILFGPDRPGAIRLFAGESEGLPGVVVDRFSDFVVAQWFSEGALPWRDELYGAIESTVRPRGIYEQKRFRPLAGKAPPEPAARVRGEEAPLELVVEELGCRFAVDVTAPLGVGLFADMRLGRAAVAARSAERRMLNLFSYTGAFSVCAARAGATELVAVDQASRAHARARRNFELSGLDPGRLETVTADATSALERFRARGRRFDLIVCDPPTFSHGPGGSFPLARELATVAGGALSVLEPGGLLALATNSTRISAADVERALGEAGAKERVDLRVVERVGLPPDFPVSPGFPEGNYLKFVLCIRA